MSPGSQSPLSLRTTKMLLIVISLTTGFFTICTSQETPATNITSFTTMTNNTNVTITAVPPQQQLQTTLAANVTTAPGVNNDTNVVTTTVAPVSTATKSNNATGEVSPSSSSGNATEGVSPSSSGGNATEGVSPSSSGNSTSPSVTPPMTTNVPLSSTPAPTPSPTDVLCQSDHDEIGQRLGCSCIKDKEDNQLKALCSDQLIDCNNTNVLPNRLKLSTALRAIDFSKNYISKLTNETFENCSRLKTLDFKQNQIKIVHHLNCSRLMRLDLSGNQLKNLTNDAFVDLPNLEYLDLSYNELVFLDKAVFTTLESLRILNLASNPIGEELLYSKDYMISLKELHYLEELNLANTSLQNFPDSLIAGTRNLKRLRLNNNKITALPTGTFQELSLLEELDFSGNPIKTLEPQGFFGLSSLKTLTIDRMKLVDIQANAFGGLGQLKTLQCTYNHALIKINEKAFKGDPLLEGSFDCNPKIVRLNDNSLTYFEPQLLNWTTLEELDLFRNPWICDCNFQWIPLFIKKSAPDAAMLIDKEFKCYEPPPWHDTPLSLMDEDEMLCYSAAASVAGRIAIAVFSFLLLIFCTFILLHHFKLLPEWISRYNIFGTGFSSPKYKRVNPKPSGRSRIMEIFGRSPATSTGYNYNGPDANSELEWDNGDIGRR